MEYKIPGKSEVTEIERCEKQIHFLYCAFFYSDKQAFLVLVHTDFPIQHLPYSPYMRLGY